MLCGQHGGRQARALGREQHAANRDSAGAQARPIARHRQPVARALPTLKVERGVERTRADRLCADAQHPVRRIEVQAAGEYAAQRCARVQPRKSLRVRTPAADRQC